MKQIKFIKKKNFHKFRNILSENNIVDLNDTLWNNNKFKIFKYMRRSFFGMAGISRRILIDSIKKMYLLKLCSQFEIIVVYSN